MTWADVMIDGLTDLLFDLNILVVATEANAVPVSYAVDVLVDMMIEVLSPVVLFRFTIFSATDTGVDILTGLNANFLINVIIDLEFAIRAA